MILRDGLVEPSAPIPASRYVGAESQFLFNGAWISAAFVAFLLYALLMRPSPRFAIPETS